MLLLEVQTWSSSDSIETTIRDINSASFQFTNQLCPAIISSRIEIYIICQTQASSSYIPHPVRALFLNLRQLLLKVCTNLDSAHHQVLLADNFVLLGHKHRSHGVSHPGVKVPEGKLCPELIWIVEATCLGLLGEGDEVGRGVQVPVFVSPELTTACDTSVHFINDHVDSHFFSHFTQLICKKACDMMIASR